MIILEGCDCTGKTTLASRLAERYHSPVTHYSKHEPEVMLEHAKIGAPGVEEIVDRFHMSEIPYSMYFRHTIPQYDSVKEIDLVLRDTKCLQIVCSPTWNFVKARWEDRRDDELVKSLQAIHGIYLWYRDKSQAFSSFPVWYYDYTTTSVESLCEKIDIWSEE